MPRTSSPDVFELIRSLSKPEKRYVTLFLSRNAPGGQSGYLQLFQVLDKLESFDEAEVFSAIPGLDRRRLPNRKRRLYQRILEALRSMYSGDNAATTIRENMQSAEILYKKGLYELCWKLLEKTKTIAYRNERIHILPEIINWQKRRLVLRIRTPNTRTSYRRVVEEEQRVHRLLLDTLTVEELSSRLYAVFIKNGRVNRDTAELAGLRAELLPWEEKYLTGETGFWEGSYINSAAQYYYQAIGDFESSYRFTRKKLESYDKRPFMLREEPVLYSYALNHCAISQVVLGKYGEARETFEQLRNFGRNAAGAPGAPSAVSVYETAFFLELEMHLRRGDCAEALRVLAELMPMLGSYDKSMHNVNIFSKYYRIALAWFIAGRYPNALHWTNEVCNAGELVSRRDIFISVRMLNLLTHFELEQFDVVEYLADSYRRHFQRLGCLHASEDLLLRFFHRAGSFPARRDMHTALRKLLKSLLALRREQHLERFAFAYFNVCDWIAAQLSGRRYADVIAGKERLEDDVF